MNALFELIMIVVNIWLVISIFFLADESRRARKYEREMGEIYSRILNLSTELIIDLKELKDKNDELQRKVNHYESTI
jgi:hypothetical protein